ncbi:hypothetical protein [Rhodoferax antarcticus]|uniref:Uncharacterized protein n=1 Tax=Rhodoferax antarcticus ANT.BR TaxID=1111071 RepID=A0A1Q8Y9C0_9BURK|nr:hypothetical protein [Rhodoferax antarcticus]OLP04470.1 hypothetical protein BLL52_4119 [Rhodoferax antarcticus ANT.BR]
MRSTFFASSSATVSAFPAQFICQQSGLELLKTVNADVIGPQGINFDGAIIARGDTGVSVLWFIKASQEIEVFCAEPLQCSSHAKAIVETYLQ